jgi:hypothetical protein
MNHFLFFKSFLCCLFFYQISEAQLPICNLYKADIQDLNTSKWHFNRISLLSNFNPNGYNNQPFQIDENHFLATIKTNQEESTEIYSFDLIKGNYTRLITNSGSDYSPRINTGMNDEITCIHVPKDDSTQKLVAYDKYTGVFKRTVLGDQGKIGYYRNLGKNKWVCFILDDQNIMAICEENRLSRRVFAANIGRTFEATSADEIIFVHKILNDKWLLKSYSLSKEKLITIAEMPKNVEDFAVLENNRIICAQDSRILQLEPGSQNWKEVADLSPLGIRNINRLNLYKNSLIFVTVIP